MHQKHYVKPQTFFLTYDGNILIKEKYLKFTTIIYLLQARQVKWSSKMICNKQQKGILRMKEITALV